MDHVSPAHWCLKIERFRVIWNHSKVKLVAITFFDQFEIGHFGLFGVELGLSSFQVGIKDKEGCRADKHDHQEEKVLEQETQKLAWAHFLLLDEQIVGAATLFAVNALASNNFGRHAVRVHEVGRAATWIDKFGRYL